MPYPIEVPTDYFGPQRLPSTSCARPFCNFILENTLPERRPKRITYKKSPPFYPNIKRRNKTLHTFRHFWNVLVKFVIG